jgi:PAS domain S-box-containing protein
MARANLSSFGAIDSLTTRCDPYIVGTGWELRGDSGWGTRAKQRAPSPTKIELHTGVGGLPIVGNEHQQAAMLCLSASGKISDLSSPTVRLLGYSPDDLLGRNLLGFVHPDDTERFAQAFAALAAVPGHTVAGDARLTHADGSWHLIGWVATNQLDTPGISALVVHVWEVRRGGPAPPPIDTVADQFRVLIENAAHITAIVEADGHVRYVSPAVERMLGYAPDNLKGVHVSDLLHPDDAAAVLLALEYRVQTPGRGRLVQFRARHKDGSWRVLEAIATNRLDDPIIAGMVIDARDVTERKWSAERLQRSLEALLAIHDVGRILGSSLEQQAIASALLDGVHRVAPIEAAALFLRTTHGSLHLSRTLGSPPLLEATRSSRSARAARQQVLSGGPPQFFRCSLKNLDSAYAEACALPLRVQDRIIGVVEVYGRSSAESWPIDELGSLADQAASALERTRLYQALSERERRLEHLVRKLLLAQEEERRRVAYEVHDGLAQLAAAAQQHLEAFATRYRSRSRERAEELQTALDLAGQTVREARRMIAGFRPTVLDDFGLAPAISYELQGLRSQGWYIEYIDKLGPVRLDPMLETALFRVLQEALANARKHAQTTRVAVTIERRNHSVRLEIRDWGRGFRPAAVRTRGGPSERVGLAGMQERIALLHGRCAIHSRPGAGTRINVEVPLREAPGKA